MIIVGFIRGTKISQKPKTTKHWQFTKTFPGSRMRTYETKTYSYLQDTKQQFRKQPEDA